MENYRPIAYSQVCEENEGSMGTGPTSSILKLPKQLKRAPLQDLNVQLHSAVGTPPTGHLCTKRVSFRRAIQTKEFHIEDATTSWASTYEENFKSSDGSSDNDSIWDAKGPRDCGTDKLSIPRQIYCKVVDVDQKEFIHKKQETQTPKIQEETSPVCDDDMELTCDIKWNEIYYSEEVNRFVGDMQSLRKTPQIQTSNPLQIYSRTGTVSDTLLTSGIKQNDICNAVHMSKDISDDELTCQWPQKQISNPIEVPSHTGNGTDMDLTSGIKWTETGNEAGLKTYVSDIERRSERPRKQMVHQIYVCGDGNASDMELTNTMKQKEMSTSVMKWKEISDMDLTSGIKWTETGNEAGLKTYVSDIERRSERPRKQMVHQIYVCGDGNASDMELTNTMKQKEMSTSVMKWKEISDMDLTSGIKWTETGNEAGLKTYVSDIERRSERPRKQMVDQIYVCGDDNASGMELTNTMKQKEMSTSVMKWKEISDMDLTSGIKWTETGNEAGLKTYVSDIERRSERPRKQMVDQIYVCGDDNASGMELTNTMKQKEMSTSVMKWKEISDMDLTSGMKWTETGNEAGLKTYVGDIERRSERPRKQMVDQIYVCGDGNASGMELTNTMKQKEMSTSVMKWKEISDMDLTSGIKWTETGNEAGLKTYVSDIERRSERPRKQMVDQIYVCGDDNASGMELTNTMKQKEMSTSVMKWKEISDMDLTSGIKWTETGNEAGLKTYVSDIERRSERPRKQMVDQIYVCGDDNASGMELTNTMKQKEMSTSVMKWKEISDMDLTSGIKWTETGNEAGLKTYVGDIERRSERPRKQMVDQIYVCGDDNASGMELTNTMKQKEMSTSVMKWKEISDMDLTSGMKWTETGNEAGLKTYVSDIERRSERPRKQMVDQIYVCGDDNASGMELTNTMKQKEMSTSVMKWKEINNAVEVNRCVNIKELPGERSQQEISNPTGLSSLIHSDTGMKLTHAMNWKETYKAVEMNRYGSDMSLRSEGPQREVFNALGASNHANVSDMELTNGMKLTKMYSAIDMNWHISDMSLTCEGPQREIFNPSAASSHTNVSDMDLTSGMQWKKTFKLGEVNQSVTDMEVISEKRWEQTSSPIETSSCNEVSNMKLRSDEKGKEINNVGDVSDMGQSDRSESARFAVCAGVDDLGLRNEVIQMNMEFSGDNLKGINNQLHVFSTYANSSNTENIDFMHHKQKEFHTDMRSETNNISGTSTMLEVPKLSFNHISNIDGKKLSKHKEMGDVEGMSCHSVQPMNVKQTDTATLLHNNDSEDTKRQSELEVHIGPCGDTNSDKACQSDHGQVKTSLGHTILSGESTVETLDNLGKFHAQDMSFTLVNQVEGQYNLPFSKASLASTEGRYCEQGMSEVEGINESGSYKSRELQVENHTSAKTSVSAVGLNLSNRLNVKNVGNMSNECDILKLNQGSVYRNIKNTADKSGHSQGNYDTENLDSSSNKLKQVSPTCKIDNRITKENLNMYEQLSEGSTYTLRTTGAMKELAIGFDSVRNATSSNTDSVGNAASHDIQEVQFARKRVEEKTHSQGGLLENTQILKSQKSNSLLLKEVDGKQGHASMKPVSYECLEAGDLQLQTPPGLQALPTVERPRNATPANSTQPLEINQNLSHLEIENTSIPGEMEFNVIRDLSPETDESYKKLLECVSMADECVHEKVSMKSNESAMLGNSQATEKNYKDRTSLLEELKNNENTLNGPVTRGQKGSPDGAPVMSTSKQMCEHGEPQKMRKDANEDVTTALVQKRIKEEELRSGCEWKINEMSHGLWTFHFLYESLTLTLKLNPCETDGNSKVIMDVQLISHATESADTRAKFVHNVLLKKFHFRALGSMCKTTLDVPEVLETISVEVKKMKVFVKNIIELEILDLLKIEDNCASFDVVNLHIHAWFCIKVNLDMWEDVSPADVSVENVIGNVKEGEIKHLVTAATRGPNCLKDYVRLIKDYVDVLAKN